MCNIKSNNPKEQQCAFCQWCFAICFAVSVLLIVTGFLMPPKGEIDGSVLTAVGELLLFPSLAFGFRAIMAGMELHITKGDTHIEISKDDDDDDNK